jgi:hypothetical protein
MKFEGTCQEHLSDVLVWQILQRTDVVNQILGHGKWITEFEDVLWSIIAHVLEP